MSLIALGLVIILTYTSLKASPALTSPKSVKLPVIMYHLITTKGKYVGKFGITPETMEQDLKYLSENRYTAVVMSELVDYVENGGELPEKPILITFDDGYSSDYNILYPLLEKYGMKAVSSIVGQYTDDSDKADYSVKPYLDWAQVKELSDSGIIEIQNHSYNLHEPPIGSGKKRSESLEAYKERLKKDLSKMQETIWSHTGIVPNMYAYPLGVIGDGSEDVLKDIGIKSSLSSTEGINTVKQGDPQCLFMLKRYNRSQGKSVRDILDEIARKLESKLESKPESKPES